MFVQVLYLFIVNIILRHVRRVGIIGKTVFIILLKRKLTVPYILPSSRDHHHP